MNSLPKLKKLMLACAMTAVVIAGATMSSMAQSYRIAPASGAITWGQIGVGIPSNGSQVSVTNTGTTPLVVTSFSMTPSQFHLIDGYAPATVNPGATTSFQINFVPDAAVTFTGTFSLNIQGVPTPIVITLTGTGRKTNAVAQVTPSTYAFSQSVGTSAAPMTVSVSNTGTTNMTLNAVTINAPFTVTGPSVPLIVKPGFTYNYQVSFFAPSLSTYTSTLYFTFDAVPAKGVSLTGTGLPATSLNVTSYPVLPSGVQNAAYLATLQAAGGTDALTWNLASGSVLPDGLSLSSSGAITGTVAPTVAAGNYPVTVQVTDSAIPPVASTALMTLPVAAPTGAVCNNIVFNVPGTSTPMVPLTDLGSGTYQGVQGGLYANGSNVRPAGHDAAGLAFANAITPLDASGNPDPVNGKEVLIAIGMSTAHTEFDGFVSAAKADPTVNPKLVLVNGAMNGVLATRYADVNDAVWNSVVNFMLPQSGVTANQVVAAWVSESNAIVSGTYPTDMTKLQQYYESIARNLHTYFPNLKVAYYSSRFYTGYSNGLAHPANDEPYAYESGFAVRGAIADQIGGLGGLNYDPANGVVKAPWIAWGPYYWANGLLARNDGLYFACPDIKADGNHPSVAIGKPKDANIILNFFKTDTTTTPWFLAH